MMLVMLMLCFSQFEGLTKEATIEVLPDAGLVLAKAPNQTYVSIYKLEGQKIKDLELDAMPGPICEASGHIFINTLKNDGTIVLWVISSNLVHVRRVAGICFESPNFVDGKLFGYDFARNSSTNDLFPKIAQAFDMKSLRYTNESMMKVPEVFQKNILRANTFWMFNWGSAKLAFFKNSMHAYVYSDEYFQNERLEDDNTSPGSIQAIPLLSDERVKNPGPFKLKTVMREDLAHQARKEWYQNKTIIFTAWTNDKKILIAFGQTATSMTFLGVMSGSLTFRAVQEFDGKIIAGKNNSAWVYRLHNGSPTITKLDLRELTY